MENIILNVLNSGKFNNCKFESFDCLNEVHKNFIQKHNITDFPTVFIMDKNKVLKTIVGTITVETLEKALEEALNKKLIN